MTSIIRRNITSVSWLGVANWIGIVVLFGKSIMLARLLPVDLFGVYTLATSAISASTPLVDFGMGAALLHRHVESRNEVQAGASYFTLRLIASGVWTSVLLIGMIAAYEGGLRTALVTLVLLTGTHHALLHVPRVILVRRVMHRRLAAIEIASDVIGTIVGIVLAAAGTGIWALVSASGVNLIVGWLFLYVVKPFWRPSLRWSESATRYLLGYGSRVVAADVVLRLLDTLDDMWTGLVLGSEQLGFYSRAYKFATYPRQVVAMPVNRVILGTYAELTERRRELSQAFFRSNALLIRAGFLMAGLLALIAPEFIRLLLTDKWLPMLVPFRLMLVFTLLDPIKLSIGHLFVAVGQPGRLLRVRLVQLGVLLAGLATLGPWLGIAGVALAVNLMLLAGTIILLWKSRAFVDFSLSRLFIAPTLALVLGIASSFVMLELTTATDSDWSNATLKGLPFGLVYVLVLTILERTVIRELLAFVQARVAWRSVARGDR